jgi:hypothetical protein
MSFHTPMTILPVLPPSGPLKDKDEERPLPHVDQDAIVYWDQRKSDPSGPFVFPYNDGVLH